MTTNASNLVLETILSLWAKGREKGQPRDLAAAGPSDMAFKDIWPVDFLWVPTVPGFLTLENKKLQRHGMEP